MLQDLKLMVGSSLVSMLEIHLLNIQSSTVISYVYAGAHKLHKHSTKGPICQNRNSE